MKRCLLCFFVIALLFNSMRGYSQTFTKAQIEEMTMRIRRMSPQQVIKYRDSLMKAIMGKQAKALPNGNLLLKKHNFDTTYTTVSFVYTKTYNGVGGNSTYSCNGISRKAPVLYEANGHTQVQCAFNPRAADNNTDDMDNAASALKKSQQYMTTAQATTAGSLGAQMNFSSTLVKDNSLTGDASYGEPHVRIKSINNITFSFMYDPQQHYATVGAGADLTIIRTIPEGVYMVDHIEGAGVGMGATTDMSQATLAGAGPVRNDPNTAFAKVVKTPRGFKITYNKTQHDDLGTITETFTASIGEPIADYDVVIKPATTFDYEHWIPMGAKVDGSGDKKGDNKSMFSIIVRDKANAAKLYPGTYTVKWKLKEVTRYPGICSNYPLQSAHPNKDKDLRFDESVQDDPNFKKLLVDDSVAVTEDGKGADGVIKIMSLDYGSWGKLYAEVTLDNGQIIMAHPYYEQAVGYLTIPFDKDENKLADAWETKVHILGKKHKLDWDEDLLPDNNHPGDDISLIDEYRGFMTEDKDDKPEYTRFTPETKELFTVGLTDKSAFGKIFKSSVREGALNYRKLTKVTVYHFTSSVYAIAEEGVNAHYGRWVNWNSPIYHHTDGVIIYCYDTQNPSSIPENDDGNHKKQSLGSTGPVFAQTDGYTGAQPPAETDFVEIWTYDITHFNEQVVNLRTWYLPKRPEGNDNFNKSINKHVLHANQLYHVNLDPMTLSNIADPQAARNLPLLISYTVTHEIGHATNVHHHHLAQEKQGGFYMGVSNCPMRYWFDTGQEDDHADWIPMFASGLWDPTKLKTPSGVSMELCKTDDNCFSQMKLKKGGR
jgi:hypothetical protein